MVYEFPEKTNEPGFLNSLPQLSVKTGTG